MKRLYILGNKSLKQIGFRNTIYPEFSCKRCNWLVMHELKDFVKCSLHGILIQEKDSHRVYCRKSFSLLEITEE